MKRCAFFLLLTAIFAPQATPEIEITAEPHHRQALTNAQVRVFNVDVPPDGEVLMHWHRHDYVYVILSDSEVVNTIEGKNPVDLKLHVGDTALLAAHFAHAAHNVSDQPFRSVIIELLQDETLRHSPAKWDEDRALNILPGGTQHILFVKDAVRVSEYELQPAGMVPTHHHAGPHLVVALTDYEIRSDQAGKPPVTAAMKAGESKWVPGGVSHTLTNSGHTLAKFVTVEFP
jgi:quercetin dioxygenase-like cupin family protein